MCIAPTEEKSDDSKGSFYDELEQVFDHFPKYNMNILLGVFNAKLGREDTFKPTRSSSLLSKNTKIKIYRTTILPVVLY
jgi:hypothetical protein